MSTTISIYYVIVFENKLILILEGCENIVYSPVIYLHKEKHSNCQNCSASVIFVTSDVFPGGLLKSDVRLLFSWSLISDNKVSFSIAIQPALFHSWLQPFHGRSYRNVCTRYSSIQALNTL